MAEQEVQEVDQEVEAPQADDLQKQWEAEKAKILSKNEELLGELKGIKARAREAEEAAERERLEKAKKNGDYEQLLKSSETEREKAQQELEKLRQGINQEKVGNQAMKLAAELADGVNAELLSDYVAKRLTYTDQGVKVLDASGELTVSSLDDLKAEFQNSPRFQSLLRGNQASGSGAPGGKGSADLKTIKRSEFDSLSHAKRAESVKKGIKVIDD